MSLIKFFTGRPGNLDELIKVAKKDKSQINVMFFSWDEELQTGDTAVRGKVIYSCRGKNVHSKEESPKKTYRLKFRPMIYGGGMFDGKWNGKRMLNTLVETQESNLELLKQEGVDYHLRLMNRCFWDNYKSN